MSLFSFFGGGIGATAQIEDTKPAPSRIKYYPPKCVLGAVCEAMAHYGVDQTWPYFCGRCEVGGRIGVILGWDCWNCGQADRVRLKHAA